MNFDETIKLCCEKFCNPNSAKAKDADVKQFIVKWWNNHKELMNIYYTNQSLSDLMQLKNRGSISTYLYHRIPTLNYEKNTKLIKQWLFDFTLNFRMYKE